VGDVLTVGKGELVVISEKIKKRQKKIEKPIDK
jgi:hypothetical protein